MGTSMGARAGSLFSRSNCASAGRNPWRGRAGKGRGGEGGKGRGGEGREGRGGRGGRGWVVLETPGHTSVLLGEGEWAAGITSATSAIHARLPLRRKEWTQYLLLWQRHSPCSTHQ